jgi:signal transduction histidine kinase
MSILIVAWSMTSAACAMLGLMQLFLWLNDARDPAYPLAVVMAFAAAVVALLEMALFSSPQQAAHQQLLLWQNLAVATVVITMVWTARAYLPVARTWMALGITVLWVLGVIINFLLPGNLTFVDVQSVDPRATFWGESFYVARGTVNPWKWLADITVVLVPLYVIDAAWRDRRRDQREQRWVITAGMLLFILFAGVQAILVDAGRLDAPYMISAAFLSIVFALTWVLAREAVRARALALEVTRARRETERLMRANLLGEVAAALAHELNQPLAAILGNAQAAQKFLAAPRPDMAEIRTILADIVRDDKRARDIIHSMRRMLRSERARDTPVDLGVAVREVLELVSQQFEENRVVLRFDIVGDVPFVRGDGVALQQVVLNLVLNAEHAMTAAQVSRPMVEVRLRESRGGVEIEVRDTGPGIADELQSRLFDAFVTTHPGSLGMGLAICRRIVEAHGGSLTAENADKGGARFRAWLPAGGG